MTLNLINSKYRNTKEINFLLNNGTTEKEIIEAKDNRKQIRQLIRFAKGYECLKEIYEIGDGVQIWTH